MRLSVDNSSLCNERYQAVRNVPFVVSLFLRKMLPQELYFSDTLLLIGTFRTFYFLETKNVT